MHKIPTQTNLEDIMLSEISQTNKNTVDSSYSRTHMNNLGYDQNSGLTLCSKSQVMGWVLAACIIVNKVSQCMKGICKHIQPSIWGKILYALMEGNSPSK